MRCRLLLHGKNFRFFHLAKRVTPQVSPRHFHNYLTAWYGSVRLPNMQNRQCLPGSLRGLRLATAPNDICIQMFIFISEDCFAIHLSIDSWRPFHVLPRSSTFFHASSPPHSILHRQIIPLTVVCTILHNFAQFCSRLIVLSRIRATGY